MAGEDAEGGEVDKPKPKPRGRPKAKAKGKGKAKPKSCSKKPMPDRCPNEGLPKADTYGSDVGVCGEDETEHQHEREEGKPSHSESRDAKSAPKAGDEVKEETQPKRKTRGTKKAKVDDTNLENESAGNEEPPKKKTRAGTKSDVATGGTTKKKAAQKGKKRKANPEESNPETPSPEAAANPEVAANPNDGKRLKAPAKTFARRVEPASGLAKSKWNALRAAFLDFIKIRVKYASAHED